MEGKKIFIIVGGLVVAGAGWVIGRSIYRRHLINKVIYKMKEHDDIQDKDIPSYTKELERKTTADIKQKLEAHDVFAHSTPAVN